MNLTGEQELLIRRKIAEQIDTLDADLHIVPSPIYFDTRAGFFNVLAPQATQKQIETKLIDALWISYLRFEDNADAGCGLENPEVTVFYRLHLFCEYGFDRVDESDGFLTRVLDRERRFMDLLLKIREQFLGENEIDALPAEIESATTVNVEQGDFSETRSPADFIAGADGFTADLILQTRILMSEE